MNLYTSPVFYNVSRDQVMACISSLWTSHRNVIKAPLAREYALMHCGCLSVRSVRVCLLSVCRQMRTKYEIFFDDLESPTWAFQRTHYWTPKIQDGRVPPPWKSDFDEIWYINADRGLYLKLQWLRSRFLPCGITQPIGRRRNIANRKIRFDTVYLKGRL